ncbi:MAG: hypothetical protein ACI9KE_004050 [Polyangiales bacterium]|jgi:hypothetical protein
MRSPFLLLTLVACASQAPSPEHAPPTPVVAHYDAPSVQGEIPRGALAGVLELGLPRFLRGVITEPHLESGSFVGYRIMQMYPDDPRFQSLDLQPGDTVTRVNGRSIERPEQAYEVWMSLRVSSELLVDFLHEGEQRQIRFAIVD